MFVALAVGLALVASVFAKSRFGLALARGSALLLLGSSAFASIAALSGTHASVTPLLAYDELSALLVPLVSIAACAALFAAPACELDAAALRSLLLSLACSIVAFCARDLTLFTAAWVLDLAALWSGLTQPQAASLRRAVRRYALLGTLPLLAALATLYASGRGSSLLDTAALATASLDVDGAPLPSALQHVVFILLALAAAFRSGLLPLHSWLPALPALSPAPIAALRFAAPLGPVLIARALLPLTPAVASTDLTAFSSWAVASALYLALVGLAQRDLRRAVGFVLSSQSAMLLFGLCASDRESMHGALLGLLATGLAGTGLVLLGAALAARLGSSDLERVSGRGRRFGHMAALFFLTSAACIGVPGSLAYVSEDLLLHGLLRTNALGAALLLVIGVMNGITLLRSFFGAFQGPSAKGAERGGDLMPREGAVLGALFALSLVAGFHPRLLIALQEHSVRALSARAAPADAGDHEARVGRL